MGEFFRGWKRKVGCVTLVMGLVFTGGWIRSLTVTDLVAIPLGKHTLTGLFSTAHSLTWLSQSDAAVKLGWDYQWDTFASSQKVCDPFRALVILQWQWQWRWCGFGAGGWSYSDSKSPPQRMAILIVPYWSIVLPLTLISAILLLTKPRKAIPKKSAEPISAERATS